jgi:hypothetical protein
MLDVAFFQNKKIAALAWRRQLGFIYVLTQAKQQDREGVFPSKAVLKVAAGMFRDGVDDWMVGGLVHDSAALCDKCVTAFPDIEDGSVVVHDWSEYQVSRTTSWRLDKAVGETTVKQPGNTGETPVKHPSRARVTRFLVPSSETKTTEGVQGEPDAWDAFQRRTGEVPGQKMRDWLNELSDTHGESRVVEMIGRLAKTQRTSVDYLKAVRDGLRSEDLDAERAERQAEKAAVAAKRRPVAVRAPEDITPEEAKRLAAVWLAESKAPA